MTIGPNELRTAIVMTKRANCSGEESLAVAQAILALEEEYKAQAQVAQAVAEKQAKGPAPKGGKKRPARKPK